MERIKTTACRTLAAMLIATVMAFAAAMALPMQAQAASADDIAVGDFVDIGKADVEGYTGTPHWRVLDKADDGSLLLMSESLWTGNGVDNATLSIQFTARGEYKAYDWRGTKAETWCNDFETKVLGDVEGLIIKPTTKSDSEYHYKQTLYGEHGKSLTFRGSGSNPALASNKVFFLSAEEAATYLTDSDENEPEKRVAYLPDGNEGAPWLLRSTETSGYDMAAQVKGDGEFTSVSPYDTRSAARPVFWASFAEGTTFTATEAGGVKTWAIGEDPIEPPSDATVSIVERTNKCIGYEVTEVPWSYSQYQTDKIPPIYVANLRPDIAFYTLRENGFTVAGAHKIVYPFSWGGGSTFDENEGSLENSCTSGSAGASGNLGLGDVEDDEALGIANLVDAWTMSGLEASTLPDATDLFNVLKAYAKDPSNPEATSTDIYWVRGAGTPERIAQGVSDYIVVALYDEDATQIDGHVWGETPTWEWTGSDEDGYTAAKAIITCANDASHTKKADAAITSETVGDRTIYTAAATIDGKEYTDTKTVITGPAVLSIASVSFEATEFEFAGGTLAGTVAGENLGLASADDFKLTQGVDDSGLAATYEVAANGKSATVSFALPENSADEDAVYTFQVVNKETGAFFTADEIPGAETAVTVKAHIEVPVEETITIGEGTGTTPQVPFWTGYKYSAAQQIYKASEIGRSGLIKSVAFNVATAAPSYSISKLEIYMGTTNQDTIGQSTSFSNADLTLVYSGAPGSALSQTVGWHAIPLTKPFAYSAENGNLVVAVTAETNGELGLQFYRTMGDTVLTINRGSDADSRVADLSVPDSELGVNDTYTERGFRADVQLGFGSGGDVPAKPANVVIGRVEGADEFQPAADGKYVWDAQHGDFSSNLAGLVEADDFKLQTKKPADEEWTDSNAGAIAIAAGNEGFTVTITATIPDNVDTYDKQWRVVYKGSDPSNQIPTCGSNTYTQLAAEAPVAVDKTALEAAIAAAKAAEDGVKVSADGSDVDSADKYVTEAAKKELDDAIAAAEAVAAKADATQAEVDAAKNAVAAAQSAFEGAKKPGTKQEPVEDPVAKPVDTSALAEAIEAAVAAQNGDADKYASDAVKEIYGQAISAAQAIIAKDGVTQAEIDEAVRVLNSAKEAFDKVIADGKAEAGKAAAEAEKAAAEAEKAARANQKGKDGTAVGEGASAEAAEAAILAASSDEGPAGSKFGKLKLRSTKQAKKSITLKWAKVKGAKSYVVYAGKCGTKGMKKAGELAKTTLVLKKAMGKKLAAGKNYKAIVVALDKNNNVVTTSKVAHVTTKGGKAVNASKVTTKAKKNKVALKVGKSFNLKAKAVPSVADKKLVKCRKLAYESSNKKIATVTKKGVIKAKKAGKCYVYAYAHNGVFAKVKVTVKANSLKTAAALTLTA